jgi:hypothetical protein
MQGFPAWLWAILGAILPILYQSLFAKFPGWLKFVACWGFSVLVTVFVGLVFLHYTPAQLLQAVAWIIAASQAVYELLVKPAAKRFKL